MRYNLGDRIPFRVGDVVEIRSPYQPENSTPILGKVVDIFFESDAYIGEDGIVSYLLDNGKEYNELNVIKKI